MNSNYRFGNCLHEVVVNEYGGLKFVQIFNDDDEHYATQFDSAAEVYEFIEKLRAAAGEAFGVGCMRGELEVGAWYWARPAFDVDDDASYEEQTKPVPAQYLGGDSWLWPGSECDGWPCIAVVSGKIEVPAK